MIKKLSRNELREKKSIEE